MALLIVIFRVGKNQHLCRTNRWATNTPKFASAHKWSSCRTGAQVGIFRFHYERLGTDCADWTGWIVIGQWFRSACFFFGGCKPWSTAVHRFYFAFGRLFGQKAWHEAWVVCAGLSAVKLILLILQLHCVGYVRCKFSNRSWRRATLCNQVQKMQHLSLQIAVLTRMSIACQSTKVAQPWRQTW